MQQNALRKRDAGEGCCTSTWTVASGARSHGCTILAMLPHPPATGGSSWPTLRTTFHSAKAREIFGESASILDELTGEWKTKGISALPASLSSDAHADYHFRTELVEGMGMGSFVAGLQQS